MAATVICVPCYIRLHPFGSAYPGGPSPCPGHYSQAFGYYAAAVLPSARWQFRAPEHGLSGAGVPQFR